MTAKRLYIMGPSGAGKTFLLTAIRGAIKLGSPDDTLTLDLDMVGFRKAGDPDSKWTINKAIFAIMAENGNQANKRVVTAGCDGNASGMVAAARSAGFEVVSLIPPINEIAQHRKMRGDRPEKVIKAGEDWARWMQLARVLNTTVYTNGATLLESIDKEMHHDIDRR